MAYRRTWVALTGMFFALATEGFVTEVHSSEVDTAGVQAHIEALAGEIGERNLRYPQALKQAEDYISGVWRRSGYSVERHEVEAGEFRPANLEVAIRGEDPAAGCVVVGAHYDTVAGSPGANDNGSGVAALLEIGRHLRDSRLSRTVRLVAFVNEEPPYFKTRQMGSRVYAEALRERGVDIHAMLSLETIGYYSDAPGSQHYPPLFSLFYPDSGHFIGFVANFRSRGLLRRAVTAFQGASDVPVESVATFGFVPGVDWSDHWSFWRIGVPAVMVTDTAPYRYPYYHSPFDTPDKINYVTLARVIDGLIAVATALASSE